MCGEELRRAVSGRKRAFVDGANGVVRRGGRGHRAIEEDAGAKVGDDAVSRVRDEDIVGFEVFVDDSEAVEMGEASELFCEVNLVEGLVHRRKGR